MRMMMFPSMNWSVVNESKGCRTVFGVKCKKSIGWQGGMQKLHSRKENLGGYLYVGFASIFTQLGGVKIWGLRFEHWEAHFEEGRPLQDARRGRRRGEVLGHVRLLSFIWGLQLDYHEWQVSQSVAGFHHGILIFLFLLIKAALVGIFSPFESPNGW